MDALIEALLDRFEDTLKGSHLSGEANEIMVVARLAAYGHHKLGDKRKYTGEPYIVHPMEVAETVLDAGGNGAMVKAALAHDTLEHGALTREELRSAAGNDTLEIVALLTDSYGPEDGNRAARKAKTRLRLAGAGDRAKTVKLADVESNGRSIADREPRFARVYVRELLDLLAEMPGGDKIVRAKAEVTVKSAALKLGLL